MKCLVPVLACLPLLLSACEGTTEGAANAEPETGETLSGEPAGSAPPPPFADEQAEFDDDGTQADSELAAGQSAPDDENARCVIETSDANYDGPCLFHSDAGGTFSVSRADESALIPGIIFVSVAVIEPGLADVRGLTLQGINSRWGEARRSTEDRACWVGSDFRVCAY